MLHIDDCPNWEGASAAVRDALDDVGLAVPVEDVLVRTEAEAAATGFAGSPTILVDGEDLFPGAASGPDLACRIYPTERGLAGAPTRAQMADALRRRLT